MKDEMTQASGDLGALQGGPAKCRPNAAKPAVMWPFGAPILRPKS